MCLEMVKILQKTQNKEKMGILFRIIAAHLNKDSVTALQIVQRQSCMFYLVPHMVACVIHICHAHASMTTKD